MEAARYVDRHLAPVAHKVRPSQVDRLLEEAIARHMPEEAEERRRAAWDQTHLTINHHGVGIAGTSTITGEIDYLDALDLDDAVRAEAQRIGRPRQHQDPRPTPRHSPSATSPAATSPSTTPPTNQRHDRPTDQPAQSPQPAAKPDAPRAGRSCCTCTCPRPPSAAPATVPELPAARSGGWRTPGPRSPPRPSATGSAAPTCKVTVKPVVDLAEHVSVEAYEVPDRIAEPVALRDISCVFPWCTRPARRLRPDEHPCDNDHPVPYHQGGPTCSCQIAPLCRRHHRLKTHGGWTLPRPRTRHLPVDQPPPLPIPPRPHRHPRRLPRPTPLPTPTTAAPRHQPPPAET